MIAWVFFLFTLIIYHSLIAIIQGIGLTTDIYYTLETLLYVIDVSGTVVFPLKDFLTCISFIYLFWFQGTKVKSATPKQRIIRQRERSIHNNSIKDDNNSEENSSIGTSYLRGNNNFINTYSHIGRDRRQEHQPDC